MGDQITYSLSEAVEASTAGVRLFYFEREAFDAVRKSTLATKAKAELFADLARFNTLYMIARAGSGHIGSSFSSMDIVTWLYLNVLGDRDRYFSSKGHDAPGLYAVHTALGILPFDKIHALRRFGGLPGHPDVHTPGAHTNTGSLGMGVSKAKGFLFADDRRGDHTSRVFVMTGDGELQEGQFWESLGGAARRKDGRLTVIVDHNKLQSDTHVAAVSDLGDLEAKFRAFGWDVYRCDGHDFDALERVLGAIDAEEGRSTAIIADTIKGRGVSFMEHTAMAAGQEYYKYHSGAPSATDYRSAADELFNRISENAARANITLPRPKELGFEPLKPAANAERMIPAYTDAIMAEARANDKIVALDADLVLDTGLIPFKAELPDRFVECGIAEQDMVSQAGTMALAGLLPIVHSFSCFLTSRASEQIYNNCTQQGKVIYVGSLAGVLPGGPGHSHQAVRDIAAMSAMPGLTIIEPTTADQVGPALRWAIENEGSSYLRLTSIPYENRAGAKAKGELRRGRGIVLREGKDATIITLGPILTGEALKAAEALADKGIEATVAATPWANAFDTEWLRGVLSTERPLVLLENHYTDGGFASQLSQHLLVSGLAAGHRVTTLGLTRIPDCGTNVEVLASHKLDAASIAAQVAELLGK